MLRTIFVIAILLVGGVAALRGPLEALVLYLFLAYFRPEQWVWGDTFKTLPISFCVGIYVLFRMVLSGTRLRFDVRVALMVTIFALGTISTFNSSYYDWSSIYLRDFAKSLIISYVIALLGTDVARLRVIVLAITMSMAFEPTKQAFTQLLLAPGSRNDNGLPFLGDNNLAAVGMLMLVPLLIALGRTARSRSEQWLHRFLTVGALYRAVTTYSRGGFLAAAALAFVYMLRSPRRVRALAGAALAATLILSVMPDRFWDRMNTISAQEDERDRSAASRIYFWQVAVVMAQDRPLGIGLNAFTQAYDDYDWTRGLYKRKRSVHSSWFGIMAELGFGGLAIFVAIIAFAWLVSWRARRLARLGIVSQDLAHFGSALEAALAVFAVGGSFVIFQYTEMLWHFVGLTMAVNFQLSDQLARSVEANEPRMANLQPTWSGALRTTR